MKVTGFKRWHLHRCSELFLRALLAAVVLETPLLLWIPGTINEDSSIPWNVRSNAIAVELILTATVLFFFIVGLSRAKRGFTRYLLWSLLFILIAWVVLGWGLFYGMGHFLNEEAMRFASRNGLQLLKHALEFSPYAFAILPALVVANQLFILRLTALPLRQWSKINHAFLGVALLVASLVASSLISMNASNATFYNPMTGESGWAPDAWRRAIRDRTGPILALSDTIFPEAITTGERWARPTLPISEQQRSRISVETYLQSVQSAAKQWNVLVIVVESLRADTLTQLGGSRLVMPNLESLAKRSLVFSRGYAQATHSSYADPTIVSSQFPLRSRSNQDFPERIPYPRVLIYDLLRPRGYTTAIISSQNELWGGMLYYLQTPGLSYLFHSETYHRHYVEERESDFLDWVTSERRSGKIDDYDTVSELIRFIEHSGGPFFVYTNLQNSHFPYRYPEPANAPFQPQAVDFEFSFRYFPREKTQIVKNRYHNALHFVDLQLGRLFDTLTKKRLWDETIVVVTGDTGQAFYEHDFVSHAATPYEELIHVPIIVSAPQLVPGISSRLSSQADIPPTILELLGMPQHPAFQGTSMLDSTSEPPIFTMVQIPSLKELAVIDGTLKLIVDGYSKRLLFDLAGDPKEKRNLWDTHRGEGERLLNLLLSYRETQLKYYYSPERWAREYPPVLDY